MSAHWVIFLIAIPIGIFIKWLIDKSADFSGLIAKELKKEGLELLNSSYPGLFKVGPFKKVEIKIGKPLIYVGAVKHERTFYRIVEVKTKNNRKEQVWAKIDTNWFKGTKIVFKPRLSEIRK